MAPIRAANQVFLLLQEDVYTSLLVLELLSPLNDKVDILQVSGNSDNSTNN